MATSYKEYVRCMASRNPSLTALSEFLFHQPRILFESTVSCIEIDGDGIASPHQKISIDELILRVRTAKSLIAIVENIHPNNIEALGSSLDIDPFFFCGHIASSYQDVEKTPPPPLMSMLPSRIASRDFLNIHFQKVLDLGEECALHHVPYKFIAPGNIAREVRRLPALSGRAIGLLRGCISILKKQLTDDNWICLILVDPTTSDISTARVTKDSEISTTTIIQVPRRIRVEDFCDLPTYTAFRASEGSCLDPRSQNLREDMLHLFQMPPPGWEAGRPSVLALAYYPLRIAAAEWALYVLLMSRYVKYYESSFNAVQTRMSEFEQVVVLDLHRWRRRVKQSTHKLQMTRAFVEHWRIREQAISAWDDLVGDLKHLETLIDDHSRSLDALNPIIMALVQLQDTRRSISQAQDVRHLTYIALIFIPLSYIASLFSMAEQFGPGSEGFWIYWASSLPVAVAIVGLSFAVSKFHKLIVFILDVFQRQG